MPLDDRLSELLPLLDRHMSAVNVGRDDERQRIGARVLAGPERDAGTLASNIAVPAIEDLAIEDGAGLVLPVLSDVFSELVEFRACHQRKQCTVLVHL